MAESVISGSLLPEFEVWPPTNKLGNLGQIKLRVFSKPQFYHLQNGNDTNSQTPQCYKNFMS